MKVQAIKEVRYDPSVFLNVETVQEAVDIILTPEEGMDSNHRWKTETPYLMGLMEKHIAPKSYVLDYGCGIGRLAKPLIEMRQCQVVGVDISPNMRALAASCVESSSFFAIAPEMLWHLTPNMFDAALAVWTLQHCLDLPKEIMRIHEMLRPGGVLFLVNNLQRVLPTNDGQWIDDTRDIKKELSADFEQIEIGQLEGDDIAPGYMRKNTFWAVYKKR